MRALTSILVPLKDEEDFIIECLRSIKPSPGYPLEVVVIDDNSGDRTFDIVAEESERRPDLAIKLLRNRGTGKTVALNTGYLASKGSQFILLGGDDILVSEVLADRIEAVQSRNPSIAMCRYKTFSTNPLHDGIIFPRLGRRNHLAGGAVSFNRAFAELYFPIPGELPSEDAWMRAVAALFEITAPIIDKIGLHYRIHPGNTTGPTVNFERTHQLLVSHHKAYNLALERFGPDEGTREGQLRLRALINAEWYRSRGHWWMLPFLHQLTLGERVMMISNAAPWIFAIKQIVAQTRRRF